MNHRRTSYCRASVRGLGALPTAVRVGMGRAVVHGLAALAIGSGCGDNGPGSTSSAPAPRPVDRFVDVTAEAGIDFVHTSGATGKRYMPEITIGGAAWFDFDLDLYCINGNERPDTSGPGGGPTRACRPNPKASRALQTPRAVRRKHGGAAFADPTGYRDAYPHVPLRG